MKIRIDLKGTIQNALDGNLIPGADEALKVLKDKGNEIIIMASDTEKAETWLKEKNITYDKVEACDDEDSLIISPRSMGFNGEWQEWTMSEVAEFEPYYKRQERDKKGKSLEKGYIRGEAWKAEREGDAEKAKELRKKADNMFGLNDDIQDKAVEG